MIGRALLHLQQHYPEAWQVAVRSTTSRIEVCLLCAPGAWQRLTNARTLQPQSPTLLDDVARLLLRESCVLAVCCSFKPMLLDLVSRCLAAWPGDYESLEKVAAAMVSVLQVGPACAVNVVVSFFRAAPVSLLQRVVMLSDQEQLNDSRHVSALRSLLNTVYELAKRSRRFCSLWNLAPLFLLLDHPDESVGFLAASTVALYLDLSDADRLRLPALNASAERRLRAVSVAPTGAQAAALGPCLEWDLAAAREDVVPETSPSVVNVRGILLPRRAPNSSPSSSATSQGSLVYTATAVGNLQAMALALSRGKAVLVVGDTGSGKSCLVAELARLTGNPDMVAIHLGDQTDAKVLLGNYVCTDIPGEFQWQPGALTQAVTQGLWVLIEDIDLAPLDVVSVLIPLLEGRKLFIPGRGEEIVAADGFQLLATQSLTSRRAGAGAAAALASGLWTRVLIEPPSAAELALIMTSAYPSLARHALALVEAFFHLTTHRDLAWHLRSRSARDVRKWFNRIQTLHAAALGAQQQGKPFTVEARRRIFGEALDCFSAMMPPSPARTALNAELGLALALPHEIVEQYLLHRQPELKASAQTLVVGRSLALPVVSAPRIEVIQRSSGFALTRHALRTLERIAVAVSMGEPVLCVGETGVGKTAAIQYLAQQLGHELVVLNLNQQSDSSDLMGSFRPLEMRLVCAPVKRQFDDLFGRSFSRSKNAAFLAQVQASFDAGEWKRFLALLRQATKLELEEAPSAAKKQRKVPAVSLRQEWGELAAQVARLSEQHRRIKQSFAFAFVEGSLVEAVRQGRWVLLDEVNLASADMLESLSGLLEGGSILLAERGDTKPVPRHPSFRLFACMNPSTDTGRKDLPPGLRNRFSEFYIDECDSVEDISTIVKSHLNNDPRYASKVESIVTFFLSARQASSALRDGAGRAPKYSLRSLSRALEYAYRVAPLYGMDRALYEVISSSRRLFFSSSFFP
jgi:midasin